MLLIIEEYMLQHMSGKVYIAIINEWGLLKFFQVADVGAWTDCVNTYWITHRISNLFRTIFFLVVLMILMV